MSASTEKKNRQSAREAGTDKKMLAAQEAAKKQAKSKLRWTLGTAGVILLIAVILLLNSGLIYKTTACSVGDTDYSAAEVSYHYATQYYYLVNQYGSYASMLGLDTSMGLAGLKTSQSPTGEGTWRDYFLDATKKELLQTTAVKDYAEANGITLSDEETAEVESSFTDMQDYAKLQGYASFDNMLAANYGAGVNSKIALAEAKTSSLASKVIAQISDGFEYTADQLKEKYASYEGAQDLFDFAYYYVEAATVTAEDGTKAAPTEEALAEAKTIAQAIEKAYAESEGEDYLDRFNAAIALEVPDAAATEQSAYAGSYLGDNKEWMMSAERAPGDIGITEQSSGAGYYVTVFQSRSDNSYPVAQVRHILVKAEADADGKYTDEAKAAAKAKAEDILAEWKAGDKTEESFAALAEKYSEDGGSNTTGGLYDSVYKGQTTAEFDKFCFEGHKSGDTAVVYGETSSYSGYHVMYYVGEGENYCDYIARNDLKNTDTQQWLTDIEAAYTVSDGFGLRFVG